jgi:hypothetical protein
MGLCWDPVMEHGYARRFPLCETSKIQIILRMHEAYIVGNKTSIASFTYIMQSQEANRDTKVTFLMETLHHWKQQIEELQVECAALKQTTICLVRINSTTTQWPSCLLGQ